MLKINIDFGSKKWRIILFAVIALVNIIIYYPSLYHIPRADQWCYLADTADYDDLYSLITKFYSYNRVRQFNPGDSFLFRPVVFILLGVEKWAFGHNFFYWQLTGVILHLILVWYLLKLLLKIYPGIFAYLLAFFFSTLSVIQEMVIWHHINGYVLFMIFVLGALYHAYSHVLEGQTRKWRIWVIVAYLTLACFTHEFGIVVTLFLLILFFSVHSYSEKSIRRFYMVTLLLPLVFYSALNFTDMLLHMHKRMLLSESGTAVVGFPDAFVKFFGLTFGWVYAGFFPLMQHIQLTPGGRLTGGMPVPEKLFRDESTNILNYVGVATTVVLFLIIISGILSAMRILKDGNRSRLSSNVDDDREVLLIKFKFIVLLVLLISSAIVFISFARSTVHFNYLPETGLIDFNMYYSYIFWIFLILVVCMILKITESGWLEKVFKRYLRHAFAGLLVVLAFLNGFRTFSTNQNMMEIFRPTQVFVKNIDRFVQLSQAEPGFSFSFRSRPEEDIRLWFLRRAGDESGKEYFLSDILYSKYLNRTAPKYIFNYGGSARWKEMGYHIYRTDVWYTV